ncbi:MAG: TolC family protein [Bacteroidales bacterium]|nr:TolC family protein [Bacteroidales bacterium]
MKKISILLFVFLYSCNYLFARVMSDSTILLNLEEVVELARKQSPDVLVARHTFRSSYWNYCYYKANYLPSLSFSSTPNFNHSINKVALEDGTTRFVPQNQLETNINISLTQNISWTGGSIFVETDLERLDLLDNKIHSFNYDPVEILYCLFIFGRYANKWDKKIEPLSFEEAKKIYIKTLESVAFRAITHFFNLAKAQANLEIAKTNFMNADTLFFFAKGRYEVGTITENEMLQLEISKLVEEGNRMNAQLTVDDSMEALRSYLGITEPYPLRVVVDNEIPLTFIDINQALEYAFQNSPDIINFQRRKYESDRNLSSAKGSTGLKTDLYMSFGWAQTGDDIQAVYKNPLNQQYFQLAIRFPILDWGRDRGKVQLAKSQRDLEYTRIELEYRDFERNLMKLVKQFNLQPNQLSVAHKTNLTSERRNDVARKLYLMGKLTILELNESISEKDSSTRNYIHTLQNYWSLYYMLRSFTLYDFEKNIPLTEDYRLLIH